MVSFSDRLSEAIAWCRVRLDTADAPHCFRSEELRPSRNVVHECRTDKDVEEVVADVVARRCLAIRNTHGVGIDRVLPQVGDRLFAFRPQDSLFHASSPPISQGFIDEDEIAPWDTWIEAVGGHVLTWVPAAFVSHVGDAILVNPEECIRWASDWEDPIVRQYDEWFRSTQCPQERELANKAVNGSRR